MTMKLFILLSCILITNIRAGQNCPHEGRWPETVANDDAVLLCEPLPDISNIPLFQKTVSYVIPRYIKNLIVDMFSNSILETRACNINGTWSDALDSCPTAAGCWAGEKSYVRDLVCGDGEDKDAELCYKKCKEGYTGVGPVCWEQCPSEYEDKITMCKTSGAIMKTADNDKCPWYDKCGLISAKGCTRCPEGYKNLGCICSKEDMYTKDTYGRGVGTLPSLGSCKEGGRAVGPLCYVHECPAGYTSCGLLCTKDKRKCEKLVAAVLGDITTLALSSTDIVSWIMGLGTVIHDELPTLLELVLSPKC